MAPQEQEQEGQSQSPTTPSSEAYDEVGELSDSLALTTLRAELERHIAPPLLAGATPATPYAIQLKIGREMTLHTALYRRSEKEARALMEEWFRAHPHEQDLPEEQRKTIAQQAREKRIQEIEKRNPTSFTERFFRRSNPLPATPTSASSSSEAFQSFQSPASDRTTIGGSNLLEKAFHSAWQSFIGQYGQVRTDSTSTAHQYTVNSLLIHSLSMLFCLL